MSRLTGGPCRPPQADGMGRRGSRLRNDGTPDLGAVRDGFDLLVNWPPNVQIFWQGHNPDVARFVGSAKVWPVFRCTDQSAYPQRDCSGPFRRIQTCSEREPKPDLPTPFLPRFASRFSAPSPIGSSRRLSGLQNRILGTEAVLNSQCSLVPRAAAPGIHRNRSKPVCSIPRRLPTRTTQTILRCSALLRATSRTMAVRPRSFEEANCQELQLGGVARTRLDLRSPHEREIQSQEPTSGDWS